VSAFARASGAALWSIEPMGTVNTLAVLDTVLVVGGEFMPANGLLALEARTGVPATWEGSTSGGPVLALCPTPSGLAVGGAFTSAGGQPRSNLALLDRSGALVPDWDPGANGTVTSLALADSKLYCGGDFTRIGGEPRFHLAALWLDSGDVMRADEDGYFYFRGRRKQIIVHDGSNITPQEIEGVLLEHPSVEAAGVVGIHDIVHGENVRAYITLRHGAPRPTDQELIRFARAKVGYKAPEEIVVLGEMPRTATGKVDRMGLKRMAESAHESHD